MATEQKLASLKQQRSTAKGNISRIKNMLENTATSWNVIDLECRLEILSSYIKQVMAYQTEIEKEDPKDEKRGDIEELCISAKSKLMQLLGQHKRRESSAAETTLGITIPPSSRLPNLKLPTFSGKYAEYKNFVSSFNNLVHDEPTLAPIEKFNHLLSCLSGDALSTVQAFQVSEENYSKALDRLAERYDKKCLIFFDNIERLFEIPKMVKPNASALRNAVDKVSAIYDSLQSLGSESDITNALIIHLVLTKVDNGTKSRWNDQLDYSTLPTWNECAKSLIRRCQSLEVNEDRSMKPDSSTTSYLRQIKTRKSDSKVSLTCAHKENETKCLYCSSNSHFIYNCSSFAALPVTQRFEFIKKMGGCINCLKKGHSVRSCTRSHCRVCQRPHHTLLHRYQPNSELPHNGSGHPSSDDARVSSLQHPNQRSAHYAASINDVVILATAMVKIKDKYGNPHLVRALLDSGSQVNFMSEECVNKLKLKRQSKDLNVLGIGEIKASVRHIVNATVQSRLNEYSFQDDFWVLNCISSLQPEFNLNVTSWRMPKNIKLADPNFYKSQKVDLLIGADIFFELLSVGQIKIHDTLPMLQKTLLGWVVSGRYKAVGQSASCNLTNQNTEMQLASIDTTIRKFWEVEEIISKKQKFSEEQMNCEKHFLKNTQRLSSGKFEVRLPFKMQSSVLGFSYETAKRRYLALERRLMRTPEVHTSYLKFMQEYLSLGHMSPTENSIPSEPHYFIPHQVVIRPESLTTKLRVVFDASSKTTSHISLNDTLMVGPTIQPELYTTLLRFRCRKYAITADITKMYRQVQVHEADRQYQLILWRENTNMPVKIYKLNTVTYGTSPAPFLAIRCLTELGIKNKETFPVGSRVIQEDFYVDDLLSGADSLEELKQIKYEVVKILDSAGFQLAKWYSNHECLQTGDNIEKSISVNDTETTKTLGIVWHPKTDELKFNFAEKFDDCKATKRNILSISSRLFDPLGLVCPVITRAKMILQDLWMQKLDWDESIPMSLETTWRNFKENFKKLSEIKIPRFVNMDFSARVQVHGFADASIRAYGCCIYIRSNESDNCVVKLLTAKSKIAPIQTKTLPRLELCAAHLLAKLWKAIAPILLPHAEKVVFWSDSEIVLHWLKRQPSTLSTFVGNRVADIQNWSAEAIWRHVPTAQNPADIVSRSCSVDELRQSMWFEGPEFLKNDEDGWPVNAHFELTDELKSLENRKSKTALITVSNEPKIINKIIENCSSYLKLLRTIAYVYRFVKPVEKNKRSPQITAKELELAFLKIIETIQHEEFAEEIKCIAKSSLLKPHLQKLNPFIQEYEDEGRKLILLRVGGRLLNAPLEYDMKFPLLLPKTSRFVILYVTHLHLTNCHAGPRALVGLIRLRIWLINAREVARKVVRRCVHCFKYKPKLLTQIMGNLPKDRLLSVRPFVVTGVDFCGPVYTSYRIRGRPPYKTYIAVFVCFSSKAVHIEAVSDLTTNAFISVLKRFIGRRGLPEKIICDNATNFVGTNAKLNALREAFLSESTQKDVLNFIADRGVKFEFIPPRAPHFGGLWEAAVKSTKSLLYRTVANANLTYEELTTVLVEVEAVLNSRPIAPLSEDPSDGEALTPAHLLVGSSLKALPEGTSSIEELKYSKRWQHISSLKARFWYAFQRDYLLELQCRAKWVKPERNLEVGAVVMIHEDNMPPQRWLLGRVVTVVVGADGKVRVADIKTRNGIIRRAVHKLAPLPEV